MMVMHDVAQTQLDPNQHLADTPIGPDDEHMDSGGEWQTVLKDKKA